MACAYLSDVGQGTSDVRAINLAELKKIVEIANINMRNYLRDDIPRLALVMGEGVPVE